MVIGACKVTLRLHEITSLKDKRSIVKKIVERMKNKFNATVAEVGSNDVLNLAEIGIAVTGNDRSFINSVIDKMIDFIEGMFLAEIIDTEMELISL